MRIFSEIPKIFRKIRKYFGISEIFSEFPKLRFSCSEECVTDTRTCEHGPGIHYREEHIDWTFTDAFYNCVSRGHLSKIEQTQIKTCRLLRAARCRNTKPVKGLTSFLHLSSSPGGYMQTHVACQDMQRLRECVAY